MKNQAVTPSTTALIRQFRRGDETVFARIIAGLQPAIEQKIASLVPDPYIREDLYQETLIRILTGLRSGQYIETGRLQPWAVRIARNTAIDHLRSQQHNPVQSYSEWNQPVQPVPSGDSLEEKHRQEQRFSNLEQLIGHLPEGQRKVVRMHYYEDMTFREIAATTHENINTLLGRMRYALNGIRKMSVQRNLVLQ